MQYALLYGIVIIVQMQFQNVFNMIINFVPAETQNYLNWLSTIILCDVETNVFQASVYLHMWNKFNSKKFAVIFIN